VSEVARIRDSHVDWTKIKRSLDRSTCIRKDHPACEYHYTEAQAFASLSRQIRETKEFLDELIALRAKAPVSTNQCELHWIQYCSECSLQGKLDRSIKVARTVLGKLRFRLVSLPTVATALGRTREQNPVSFGNGAEFAVRAEKMNVPIERIFGRDRTGFETQRLRASDLNDNIRLIESWLRDRQKEVA
jgi:hypothetical protein